MAPNCGVQDVQERKSQLDSLPSVTKPYSAKKYDSQPGSSKATQAIEAQPREFPVSWDDSVQLGVSLNLPNQLSSGGSNSSVVDDLGNTRYLADNQSSNNVPGQSNSDSVASTEELVAYSGAGLIHTFEDVALRDVDLSATQRDKHVGEPIGEIETLGDSIRAAVIPRSIERDKFLPNDALERIVDRARICEELNAHDTIPKHKLDSLTGSISNVTEIGPQGSKRRKKTTRRRIFAILGLIEKCGDIVGFIDAGMYDSDLPFMLSDGGHPGRRRLHRKVKNGLLEPLVFLKGWSTHIHESFYDNQWQLLAPYFKLPTQEERAVLHYPLNKQTVLPFIEDDENKWDSGREGGFSEVWRIKIHPAHHNGCKDMTRPEENPSYAVKRLRHYDLSAFNSEVSNLKRFIDQDHLHLIKLLLTFEWRSRYYLLFPWADGNLLKYWKDEYPELSNPRRDHNLAMWLSKQCLGIAQGLQMIHKVDIPTRDGPPSDSAQQTRGRHGDLKPENILWFKSYEGKVESSFGVLKISDFGLARFHGTRSKSHIENVALSPTYRPPEYDIGRVVSQSFDVWSLGCVLLEFGTWYLLGGKGVEDFTDKRIDDDPREHQEDIFFDFVNIKEKNGRTQLGARAKLSVVNEFQTLYERENCFDFMLDLLEFIHDRLLRVHPQNRAKCEEIVQFLKRFNEKCSNDEGYCTTKTKKVPERTGTGLSELTASALNLSQAMTNRIRRNSLPEHTGPVERDLQSSQRTSSLSTLSSSGAMEGFALERTISPETMPGSPNRIHTVPEESAPTTDDMGELVMSKGLSYAPSVRTERPSSRSQSLRFHFKSEQEQREENWLSQSTSHSQSRATPVDSAKPSIMKTAVPILELPSPSQQGKRSSISSVDGSEPPFVLYTNQARKYGAMTNGNLSDYGSSEQPRSEQPGSELQNGGNSQVKTENIKTVSTNTKGRENEKFHSALPSTLKPDQPPGQSDSVNNETLGNPVGRKNKAPKRRTLKRISSKRISRRIKYFVCGLFRSDKSIECT